MSLKVVEINTVRTYEIMTSSCLKKWCEENGLGCLK